MMRWARSSSRYVCALFLGLGLLCLLLRPALVAACDLHDLTHASAAQTGEVADVSAADEDAESGSLLHDLLHTMHCCLHGVALLSAPFTLPAIATATTAPDTARPARLDTRRSNLFRPPITG